MTRQEVLISTEATKLKTSHAVIDRRMVAS
jgi:hypothetical protein